MNGDIAHAEVHQIRDLAVVEGIVHRDQARRLAQSWLGQHNAIARVRAVHSPIPAVDERTGRQHQVCTGCGTDAGAWQVWPCPTITALDAGALAEGGGHA